jgi:cytochrome c peroxidase
MKKTATAVCVLLLSAVLFSYLLESCRRKEFTGPAATPLAQEIPGGFPAPAYTFTDNPLTKEGFELGRKLFYDGRLSVDGNFSCSGCHEQRAAFGTYEHDLSHGHNGTHTLRNAPPLFYLAWQKTFHHDGKFTSLIEEAKQPITAHDEMGESFPNVLMKIAGDKNYREMFTAVYGDGLITPDRLTKALAQFTGFMVSANSKYDNVKKGTAVFTAGEDRGYILFKNKCATCHPEPMFTDYSFRNIGLPLDPFLNDNGKTRVTNKKEDSLKFKVPTLRNLLFTSNYMHDGRFGTLAQCLEHYRTGVQTGPTLDPLLNGGIALTAAESGDVISFLKTLSDSSFIKDIRFAKPL